ncbi:MAG: type II toxin-antitoxin system RelE/ParE family toxin [Planctomycetes bacterium]|nr:type II toxin-antitoxin system RelE/ParE family toxin [Planctomycetota bacterium]
MTTYTVQVTDAAWRAIRVEARYIAVEKRQPSTAQRWLEKVWDAVESLERWPRRFARADEAALVDYEIRRAVVGQHLLLFTVDDSCRQVTVIGFRHGHRLPRSDELPEQTP